MNGIQQAVDKISDFLESDEKGLLLTGTHQYKKHKLVMSILNTSYRNAHILFRTNAMGNITNNSFIGIPCQPRPGQHVRINGNIYEFDAFTPKNTWYATAKQFDFAIVYPIDGMCSDSKYGPIEYLTEYKKIGKMLLCSWTDRLDYDYSELRAFYSRHVVYDAEEEDPEYHDRVLSCL